MDKDLPLVSVCMITFNQEAYIASAIEGVLMQQHNFPVEVIIGEDCSKDRTREICKSYAEKNPEIRLLESEENLGMANNFLRTLQAARGKFIAICEGDDFWVDPQKLSNQVNFLQQNPDYGLVCTDYDTLNTVTGETIKSFIKGKYGIRDERDLTLEEYIFKRVYIRTLTVVFRKEYFTQYVGTTEKNITMNQAVGDLPLWLFILQRARVQYKPVTTAVYRISSGTASRPVEAEELRKFQNSVMEVVDHYIEKAGLPAKIKRRAEAQRRIYEMEYFYRRKKPGGVFSQFFAMMFRGVMRKKAFTILWASITSKEID